MLNGDCESVRGRGLRVLYVVNRICVILGLDSKAINFILSIPNLNACESREIKLRAIKPYETRF